MKPTLRSDADYKSRYTEIFNRAFRRGANERAAFGLEVSQELQAPKTIPQPSVPLKGYEQVAWEQGFATGFKVGASDAELAGVDVPGAHGMISGFSQEFLGQFGFFVE
ncbi:MAG TPA: hypothetical protein VKV04_03355 [Verrucomicrobiae bacterium]|nr:hypothetical protein [Verrucomicrobiae bacterium]